MPLEAMLPRPMNRHTSHTSLRETAWRMPEKALTTRPEQAFSRAMWAFRA